MDSLLAIFEKKTSSQNSTSSSSTRSGYDSLKKTAAPETRREPAQPAPKEASKPAPKEAAKPAPKEPSKPAPKEAAKPAPKEPALSNQDTPTYQRPMVSKSISMLMEKLKNNPIEEEEEEEVPAKPAMPRRQSLGGINVRDLASKHESSYYPSEAKASAAQNGHVKPVQMIEVAIPTIQEEAEFTEEKRPSEVIQESTNAANAKIETAQNDASLRDSFAMMMDEFDIDLDDMEEELKSLDLPSTLSSQPTMIEHSSTSAGPNTLNVKTIDIANVPADKTIPPAPTTAPPPAPSKPFQGAGAIDNVDFDSIEDLDIDSMVEEINREQEQKKQDEEKQQRESLGKVGYSFTPSRWLVRGGSPVEYHPKQEFISSGVNGVFYDVSNGKEDMSTIELSNLLRRVCDGSVTMRTVST